MSFIASSRPSSSTATPFSVMMMPPLGLYSDWGRAGVIKFNVVWVARGEGGMMPPLGLYSVFGGRG